MSQEILEAIPHREPFLFVDQVVHWSDKEILCKKTFTGNEFFYQGHYPGQPVTPGVILCEAAMQSGAILLSHLFKDSLSEEEKAFVPVVGRMNDVKFKQMVRPGDEIMIHVTLTEQMKNVYFMKAKITSGEKMVVTLDFACTHTKVPS